MMAKKINRSVFPDVADVNSVGRLAVRDLELFCDGIEEPLMDTLHTITGKQNRTRLEHTYLQYVLNNDWDYNDWE